MNWGNFISALISGVFTITAIIITIIFERKKEEENNRLQILPYLNYNYIKYNDKEKQIEDLSLSIQAKRHDKQFRIDEYTRGYLVIKNIGLRSAVEVCILQTTFDNSKTVHLREEIDAIEVNNKGVIFISVVPPSIKGFKENNNNNNMVINILIGYSDLLDYYYEQTVELILCRTINRTMDAEHNIISVNYSFGCVINNVSVPTVYKGKHIKSEKFKRMNEFNHKEYLSRKLFK